MRLVALLAILLVAPAAWAQEAPAGRTKVLSDPAGDAVEAGPAPYVEGDCPTPCPIPPAPVAAPLGAPAHPALDIWELHLHDTPEHLVVTIVVASLDEALTGMLTNDGQGRGARYAVCWEHAGAECGAGVTLHARRHAGNDFLVAIHGYREDACNTRALCSWSVPYSFKAGTPGEIEMLVPRHLLPSPIEEGAILARPEVTVSRLTTSPLLLLPPQGPPALAPEQVTLVDRAGPGEDFVVATPRVPPADHGIPVGGLGAGLLLGARADGGQDADADLVELRVVETPRTITFSHVFAGVSEAPNDQLLRLEWALQGQRFHVAEIVASERQRTLTSYACNPAEALACTDQEPVPATFEAVAGAPGYVNITYLRGDIGSPDAGAQSARLVAFADTGAGREAGAVTAYDSTSMLPPFRLLMATRATEPPPGAHRIDDASADARMPPVAGAAPDASGAEITFVEALALADGLTQLTLGLRDPGRGELPLGHSALVRAVALQEGARSTLVASYRDASRETYFCSQDTLVFATSKSLPPEDAWTPIGATVVSGPEGGNITFLVPPDCLAPWMGAREVQRMGAGSYLVRSTGVGGPEIVVVDEAMGAEPFLLALAANAPLPSEVGDAFPWAVTLAGAGVLLVAMVATPLAILRRRRARLVLPAPGVLFLGKYLVERELGRGGFGAAWLATHTKLGRLVVIKQLHPGWTGDPKAVERFRSEARLLAKLDHPHVVRVHDAEEMEGYAFFVMEYVEGGTLAELRPKPVGLAVLARVGDELLDALAAIHDAGIIHGDLKPENVLVAADGALRVADFGIARPVEPAPGIPRTMAYGAAEAAGTPLFMAPEQLEGAPPSRASDLYAAAAVLHHVATGRLLFTPAPMDVESARMAHARSAPDAGDGLLPPSLVSWLRRGLARDARDRFESAEAMREAWARAVALARAA